MIYESWHSWVQCWTICHLSPSVFFSSSLSSLFSCHKGEMDWNTRLKQRFQRVRHWDKHNEAAFAHRIVLRCLHTYSIDRGSSNSSNDDQMMEKSIITRHISKHTAVKHTFCILTSWFRCLDHSQCSTPDCAVCCILYSLVLRITHKYAFFVSMFVPLQHLHNSVIELGAKIRHYKAQFSQNSLSVYYADAFLVRYASKGHYNQL